MKDAFLRFPLWAIRRRPKGTRNYSIYSTRKESIIKGEIMKKYAYNDITLMQYIVLINGMQVGTGVLSLPRVLAEKAGTDGWIAILIGWIFSTISGVFICENSCKISRGHAL